MMSVVLVGRVKSCTHDLSGASVLCHNHIYLPDPDVIGHLEADCRVTRGDHILVTGSVQALRRLWTLNHESHNLGPRTEKQAMDNGDLCSTSVL